MFNIKKKLHEWFQTAATKDKKDHLSYFYIDLLFSLRIPFTVTRNLILCLLNVLSISFLWLDIPFYIWFPSHLHTAKIIHYNINNINSLLNVFKLCILIILKSSGHESFSWTKWLLADNDILKKHINELNVVLNIQQRHTLMPKFQGKKNLTIKLVLYKDWSTRLKRSIYNAEPSQRFFLNVKYCYKLLL